MIAMLSVSVPKCIELFTTWCVLRTTRRAIAMMFVRLSVCLRWKCVVIIRGFKIKVG